MTTRKINLTPEGETLALRLILAAARLDRDAYAAVYKEMLQHHPGDIICELAAVAVHFATALSAVGYVQKFTDSGFRDFNRDGRDGAVEVIEQWMQAVLDEQDDESL